MLKDWATCTAEIVKALARYDKHTTYVRLERVLEIAISPAFEDNASCYTAELMADLEDGGVGRVAAQAHIRHGIALGVLNRMVAHGGTAQMDLVTRIDGTARVALSPVGKAIRAAKVLRCEDFWLFAVCGALLDSDFDMYGVLLKSAAPNRGPVQREEFARQFRGLVAARKDWLTRQIPMETTRQHIRSHLPWQRGAIESRSIEHHYNMRVQWARCLGHLDERKHLTSSGAALAALVSAAESRNGMFWLAPTRECRDRMGTTATEADLLCLGWDVLRPNVAESDPGEELVEELSKFMRDAFETIRLRTFAQAPVAAVIPYLRFLERRFEQRVDARTALEAVLRRYRRAFHCMLNVAVEDCHYQLLASR